MKSSQSEVVRKLENCHEILSIEIEKKVKENKEKMLNSLYRYIDMIMVGKAFPENKFYDLMHHYATCSVRESLSLCGCMIKVDVVYIADDDAYTKSYLSVDEKKISWYKICPRDKVYIHINNTVVASIIIRYKADVLEIQQDRYIKINEIEDIYFEYLEGDEDEP